MGSSRALERARLLAAFSDVDDDPRSEALAALDRAEAVRSATPQSESDDDEGEEEEEEGAVPPNDLWDLREARLHLLLRGSDMAAIERAFVKLGESMPEEDAEDGRRIADRRGKQAVLEELAAEIAWRKGDPGGARKRLDASRLLNPDVPRAQRLEALLLAAEGKDDDLRGRRRTGSRAPGRRARSTRSSSVRSLAQGWWDLAAVRLAAWPRLHPRADAELQSLWSDVAAAREKSPHPTTPFGAFAP